MNRIEKIERMAQMLRESRNDAKASQKDMANSLNKNVRTIQNWENGYGTPDVIELLDWFETLGINPLKYVLNWLYPNIYDDLELTEANDPKDISNAVQHYFRDVATDAQVCKAAYSIFGNTGSSWNSQLDMLTAYNHLPLYTRALVCAQIIDAYEMCAANNKLIGLDNILPDMDALKDAKEIAKQSVIDGNVGYYVNFQRKKGE